MPSSTLSLPTVAGGRSAVDLAASPSLSLQDNAQPKVSLQSCTLQLGPVAVATLLEKITTGQAVDAAAQITELTLSDVFLGTEDAARAIALLFKAFPSLEILRLARCSLSPRAVAALAPLIRESRLHTLILSGNRVGVVPELGQALAHLRVADLSACRLGDAGVQALLQGAAAGESKLEVLNLSYNRLTATAVPAVARLLEAHEKLTALDLGGNSLGVNGVAALLRVDRVATQVRSLRVDRNELGVAGTRAVFDWWKALERKPSYLDVRFNRAGQKICEEWTAAMGLDDVPDGPMLLGDEIQVMLSSL